MLGIDSSSEMIDAGPGVRPLPSALRGAGPAGLAPGRAGRRDREQRDPAVGARAPPAAARSARTRSRPAAGSPSRCPATSTSRATGCCTSWPTTRGSPPSPADLERPDAYDAATYLADLTALGCAVNAWETTYLHVLTGPDPVFRWISGTGARPVLQALPDDRREEFVARVQAPAGRGLPRAGVRHPAALPPGLRGRPAADGPAERWNTAAGDRRRAQRRPLPLRGPGGRRAGHGDQLTSAAATSSTSPTPGPGSGGAAEGWPARSPPRRCEDIRANGWRVHPICPYTVSFLDSHPEYADLRV